MPMIKVSDHTLQLIREQTQEGFSFACTATRRADQGKQDLSYLHGISKETVGAQGICMHVLTMPLGARAKPLPHLDIENG